MMFRKIFTSLSKKLLPFIISNLTLDADTVVKSDGIYLKILIEAFGYTVVRRLIPLTDDVIKDPIDIFEPAGLIKAKDLSQERKDQIIEELNAKSQIPIIRRNYKS